MIEYKKIPYIKFIPMIIITLLIYRIVNNIENIGSLLQRTSSLLSYFIWGFVIAYLLNPLMVYIERETKIKRIYSISIIYTVLISIIILIFTLITPSVIKSILDLFANIPEFANKSYDWSIDFLSKNELLNNYNISSYLKDYLNNFNSGISTYFAPGLQIIIDELMSLTSFLFKLMSGIVISIYLLADKESIIFNFKKFIYAISSEFVAIRLVDFGKIVHTTVSKYFVGK
ncbi:MAG: AI-2E family transporter, partial [Clostridiaceae bacterium]|nr:AI-2E family transporter [Clostridiaceae bacterium]